jgi:hypothetical protein
MNKGTAGGDSRLTGSLADMLDSQLPRSELAICRLAELLDDVVRLSASAGVIALLAD